MSPAHGGLPAHRQDDEPEDGEDVQNPKPHLSQAESNLIALMAAGIKSEHAPPKASLASWPVIIGAVVGLLSIIGSAATTLQGYTQLGDRLTSFGERMLSHDNRIGALETYQREGSSDRAALRAYNGLQDERLHNLTVALEQERAARLASETDSRRADADQRAVVSDLVKTIGSLQVDLKVLVDRAQRHSNVEVPERDAQVQGPQFRPR